MNCCFAVHTASLTILAALALTVQMQAAALPADPAVDAASKATQTNPPALPRVDLQGALIPISANSPANAGEWQIVRRDAHSQTLESFVTNRHSSTGRASVKSRRIVQLGSGLNYRDERGQWQPSRPEFILQPDGTAAVRTGPFKVTLPPSLASEQGIQVVTPDGTDLRLQVLGIGWFDPVSGKSVLLVRCNS